MPEGIRIDDFRDPALAGPLCISLNEKELLVLAGPAGSWMNRLASNLAGLGSRRRASSPALETPSERCLVLLKPSFFDPGRDVVHQLENRLGTFGLSRPAAREGASGWCEAEGLSRESRKKAAALPEGLLVYFSMAVPCLVKPAALVMEDPIAGMSADLAVRAVRLLQDLSRSLPVLVICSDPLRFEGVARIEAIPGVGGAR